MCDTCRSCKYFIPDSGDEKVYCALPLGIITPCECFKLRGNSDGKKVVIELSNEQITKIDELLFKESKYLTVKNYVEKAVTCLLTFDTEVYSLKGANR